MKKIVSNVEGKVFQPYASPIKVRDDVTKNYHLNADNSHLVLSSSVGSKITISSSLEVRDGFLVKGDSV